MRNDLEVLNQKAVQLQFLIEVFSVVNEGREPNYDKIHNQVVKNARPGNDLDILSARIDEMTATVSHLRPANGQTSSKLDRFLARLAGVKL